MSSILINIGGLPGGMWTPMRGEGRASFNIAAVLATGGHEVYIMDSGRELLHMPGGTARRLIPSEGLVPCDPPPLVDFRISLTEPEYEYPTPGAPAKHIVRWFWRADSNPVPSEDIRTCWYPHQVRSGWRLLPLPLLTFGWWQKNYGVTGEAVPAPRREIVWSGQWSASHYTPALLHVVDRFRSRGLIAHFTRGEEGASAIAGRGIVTPMMPYDDFLRLLRSAALHISDVGRPSSLLECLGEGVPHLLFAGGQLLDAGYPLLDIARRFDVLPRSCDADDLYRVTDRLMFTQTGNEFAAACRAAYKANEPENVLAAWAAIERAF